MTAVSSIRLFVVFLSAPESFLTRPVATCLRIAPHPPGPGFPLHAPSAYRMTSGSLLTDHRIAHTRTAARLTVGQTAHDGVYRLLETAVTAPAAVVKAEARDLPFGACGAKIQPPPSVGRLA